MSPTDEVLNLESAMLRAREKAQDEGKVLTWQELIQEARKIQKNEVQ